MGQPEGTGPLVGSRNNHGGSFVIKPCKSCCIACGVPFSVPRFDTRSGSRFTGFLARKLRFEGEPHPFPRMGSDQ